MRYAVCIALISLLGFGSSELHAQPRVPTPHSSAFAKKWDKRSFSHRLLDSLLRRHVRRGVVDYRGIRRHSLALLREYQHRLAFTRPQQLKGGRDARLAYWLNAYTAVFLRDRLLRRPAKGRLRPTARKRLLKRRKYRVGGRWLSLAQIRTHIRTTFKDPRALFALAGEAPTDPWMRRRAYTARHLDLRLRNVVRRYLAHTKRGVRLDKAQKVVWLPPLFRQYRKDFKATASKTVLGFVAAHLKDPMAAAFLKANLGKLKIRYRTASQP